MSEPTLIKKYGNRRLYDTGESCYITLEELSRKIRAGIDVRVVDAKSGEDLTQGTLTQIIIEGRGAARMLPVPLLMQLIRLGDDVLAEFFGRYLSDALTLYLEMKRGAHAVARYNPFAAVPLAASDALARVWMGSPFSGASRAAQPTPTWNPISSQRNSDDDATETIAGEHTGGRSPGAGADDDRRDQEIARLRREFDEFKRSMTQNNQSERAEPDLPTESAEPVSKSSKSRSRKRKTSR